MQRFGMMSRIAAVALGLVIAAATLVSVSAQVEAPPHHFYGTDGTAGDTIGLVDAMGTELGSATVDENGEWSISASVDPETVSYTLNGKAAERRHDLEGRKPDPGLRHGHGHGRTSRGRRRRTCW